MIVYGTRELSETESEEYWRTFNNLKSQLTSQDEELERLAVRCECKLSVVGIMGFKEELKAEAQQLIESVKQSNVKIWVLSGD